LASAGAIAGEITFCNAIFQTWLEVIAAAGRQSNSSAAQKDGKK
jgi:hypothetical protein